MVGSRTVSTAMSPGCVVITSPQSRMRCAHGSCPGRRGRPGLGWCRIDMQVTNVPPDQRPTHVAFVNLMCLLPSHLRARRAFRLGIC